MFADSLKSIDKAVISPVKRSSSDKIEQLYLQFENLKTRITTSSRRKMDSSLERSTQLRPAKRNDRPIDAPNRPTFLDKPEFNIFFDRDSTHENMRVSAHETAGSHKPSVLIGRAEEGDRKDAVYLKYMLQKTIENFMQGQMGRFQREIQQRMGKMDRKVKLTHDSLKQMHSVVILRKYKNSITDGQINSKTQNLLLCREEESASSQRLKEHYESQIAELTHHYEQKLRELSFECDKDKETHSSSINPNSKHERELLSKENEINKLQLENSKWRRMIDQLKSKNQMQLAKIEQMSEEMGEMRVKMERMQTRGQQGAAREKQLEKAKEETEMLKQILTLKDKDIAEMSTKMVELQSQLSKITPSKDEVAMASSQNIFQSLPIIPIITEPSQPHTSQFYTQLDEIEPDERSIKQFQLTKSQVVQPRRKKSMFDNMKKLEVEVNLISEENKHLKTKKDYFETQLKNTELDEERFQQQNALLKGEIRRLNTSIRTLDEVSFLFLKSGTVEGLKVQELPEGIKSKPLFLEKVSKRDKSKVK